jgi:hypothetical protein
VRATLIACLTAALLPACASEMLVTREEAIADDAAAFPQSQERLQIARRLDDQDSELLVTVNRQAGDGRPRERVAVYLQDPGTAPRYRLLRRILAGQPGSAGFAAPAIDHPLLDAGPQRVWMVRISESSGGNGGWQDDHLLSMRLAVAAYPGAPATLDDIELLPATQAYQPFLAPGEAILSAAWEDFGADPMRFRFAIWGAHDTHADPRGGSVSGTYRLRADATRPGCFRMEPDSFVRAAGGVGGEP